jgi:flagellar biosynthetic protein FliP
MKHMKYKKLCKFILMFILVIVVIFPGTSAYATNVTPDTDPEETNLEDPFEELSEDPSDGFSVGLTLNSDSEETTLSGTLQVLLLITVISIAPSILVMVTSFTRIIVVLHFVRTAVGTQSSPPNNVLIGLSLFLTVFIMSPVFSEIKTNAIDPLNSGEITTEEALSSAVEPLREFMLNQVREEDLRLFMDIAEIDTVSDASEIPITVIIPAFIISELRAAFIIGFLIYIPFIVIDMVVSSVLMSMGMMMLPPTTISMPFKILLFVLADGWNLIIGQLVNSFVF